MVNAQEFDYPAEATIGDQWARGTTEQHDKTLGRSQIRDVELHRCIARVAYQLYLRGGKQHGRHAEDWLAAENLVLSLLKCTAQDEGLDNGQKTKWFDLISNAALARSRTLIR